MFAIFYFFTIRMDCLPIAKCILLFMPVTRSAKHWNFQNFYCLNVNSENTQLKYKFWQVCWMFLLEHEKTIMKYKKIDNMLFAMFYILSAKLSERLPNDMIQFILNVILDGSNNSLKLRTEFPNVILVINIVWSPTNIELSIVGQEVNIQFLLQIILYEKLAY